MLYLVENTLRILLGSVLHLLQLQINNMGKVNQGFDTSELEKSKAHIIVRIIEYVPNAVLSKTIIRRATGNITVSSFDTGEELAEKTSPFDNYIQIIDGAAEIIINHNKFQLKKGEGIIIPAHSTHRFDANEQFKMISTVIKSGYEE